MISYGAALVVLNLVPSLFKVNGIEFKAQSSRFSVSTFNTHAERFCRRLIQRHCPLRLEEDLRGTGRFTTRQYPIPFPGKSAANSYFTFGLVVMVELQKLSE